MQPSTAFDTTNAQRTGWPWFSDSYIKIAGAPEWPPRPTVSDAPTIIDAIDDIRFEDIAESAEIAEGLARQVADAADRGHRLKVRAYAGLLSRAVHNMLLTVSELGSTS